MRAVERVKIYADAKGISTAALEKRLGLGNGTIATALRRKSPLKEDTLVKILNTFPDLSPIWLLLGKGEMYKSYSLYSAEPSFTSMASEPEEIYQPKARTKKVDESGLVAYLKEELKKMNTRLEELTEEVGRLKAAGKK